MRKLVFAVVGVMLLAAQSWAAIDFSPSFLGMYRKTMEAERELFVHAGRYGVDPRLARALIMHESGGNAQLVSPIGRQGYFQLEPAQFQQLGVPTPLEAGIKLVSQLAHQLRSEDLVLAAFQARNVDAADYGRQVSSQEREQTKTLRLESLEYIRQIEQYKSVLVLHEAAIRRQAELLRLQRVGRSDSWSSLAQATGVPEGLLRLYNPVLSGHPLQTNMQVVYPPFRQPHVLTYAGATLSYIAREGDSIPVLARVFGVDAEAFRQSNNLWRLQHLKAGTQLSVRLPPSSPFSPAYAALPAVARQLVRESPPAKRSARYNIRLHTVQPGETLTQIASRYGTSVHALMQTNEMQTSRIVSGTELRVPPGRPQEQRRETQALRQTVHTSSRIHTVQRGDTLTKIARRYGVSVRALMVANRLKSSRIRSGIPLRIPGTQQGG